MKITWAKSDQHTDWGLFKVGDVIDTTEKGIADEIVTSWTRDGFAVTVEVKHKKAAEKNGKEA
jgi:hypothetical protein